MFPHMGLRAGLITTAAVVLMAAGIDQASASTAPHTPTLPTLSSLATTLEGYATAVNLIDPSAATEIDSVATQLDAATPPTASQLDTLAGDLQSASSSLPSPVNTTVGPELDTVAGEIEQIAAAEGTVTSTTTTTTGTGTTTTGTSTTTTSTSTTTTSTGTTTTGAGTGTGTGSSSTSNLTPAQIAYFDYLVTVIEKLEKEISAANTHSGYAVVTKLSRSGKNLTVTLGCTASSNRSCSSNVTAVTGGHSVKKHVSLKGGATKRVALSLPAASASDPITVTATTGAVSTSKTLG